MIDVDLNADLITAVRDHLDTLVAELDDHTLAQLEIYTRQALDQCPTPTTISWFPLPLLPSGFWASVATLVLLFNLSNEVPYTAPLPGKAAMDLDLMVSRERWEMYDDLEFYVWLAENVPDIEQDL